MANTYNGFTQELNGVHVKKIRWDDGENFNQKQFSKFSILLHR